MKNEIFSSCCAFGSGTEEVHALKSECPIGREWGSRISRGVEEVTCIYKSGISGMVTFPCKHYKGSKKVTRNKKQKYKILCDAIEIPQAIESTEILSEAEAE